MPFMLILISPEQDVENEIPILIALMKSGLRIYHLRKPSSSKKELENYLSQIPASYRKKIVLHQHFSLSKKINLKGIHLNEKERKKYSALSKKFKIVSASFHSLEDAVLHQKKYDYLFLSPVFNSISKKNYPANETLIKNSKLLNKKNNIIALGGIKHSNILKIKKKEFAGAAFIGAVWLSKNPVRAFLNLKRKVAP